MAGVSALLLQANGKGKAVALGARERLQTTAQPLFSNHSDTSLYQTLTQQGGGLVDAYKAVHAKTSITPGQLLLNDTQYFQGKQVFHVQNNGKKSQVYRIGYVNDNIPLAFDLTTCVIQSHSCRYSYYLQRRASNPWSCPSDCK